MTSGLLALLLAGAAGAALPGRRTPLARLHPPGRRAMPRGVVVVAAVTAAAAVAAGPALAALAGAGSAVLWRVASRWIARREAERRREALGDLLAGLVAELGTGADPRRALEAAARGLPGLHPLAGAAARPSGDVRGELQHLGRLPGGRTAGDLAAAWRLAEQTGCSLAAPARRVLAAHRAEERLRRELAAQLAGPTATARLLAGLPLAGVAMGAGLGADPARFLLGPGPGRLCLLAGAVLLFLGVQWTGAITRSVLPPGEPP